ncbi:MAG: AAA family ATPase [Rhodovulum sp.]
MARIPFVDARPGREIPTAREVRGRLRRFLLGYRARARGWVDDPKEQDTFLASQLPAKDEARIDRRAARYVERLTAATRLGHLRQEDRERLAPLRDGVTLVEIGSEARADELAATLQAEMPWMAPATEAAWHAMRRSVRQGAAGFRMPPLLLVGPPGIGKSHWARRLAQVVGLPATTIDATGEPASFALTGMQRGWSSAAPGRPLTTILAQLVGNPVIVLDEVEKAGAVTSDKGRSYDMGNALLPLLEPLTARAWDCPYFQLRFDMSWITWVMTANSLSGLPAPLLSRCPPLTLPGMGIADLQAFARREGARRGLTAPAIDAIAETLDRVPRSGLEPNLRMVTRMLDRAELLENRPVYH